MKRVLTILLIHWFIQLFIMCLWVGGVENNKQFNLGFLFLNYGKFNHNADPNVVCLLNASNILVIFCNGQFPPHSFLFI